MNEPIDELSSRLTGLEAAGADLALRLTIVEAALADVVPRAAEAGRVLIALENDFELTRQAVDARVGELSSQIASRGEPAGQQQAATPAAAVIVPEGIAEILHGMLDRIERVEKLLAPVLRGKCKLMAQAI
jgi:hypothetical protein